MKISRKNRLIRNKLSNKCREFRQYHGIPISEIALAVGVPSSAIISFEKGEKDSGTILAYYITLGVDINYEKLF